MTSKSTDDSLHLDPDQFFRQLANPDILAALFDYLPRVYFYVKDRSHRFVKVNRSLWMLHGRRQEAEMIGCTDFDFHPPALATQYIAEDDVVMRDRRILADRVWLVPGADGLPRWYLSTKVPLEDRSGAIVGLAGVMRPYEHAGHAPREYRRLLPALDFVLKRFGDPITVIQIAARAHLSVSQLQREFQRLFSITPSQYLLSVRLLMARRQLEQTDDMIGKVALDTGFFDQSHFNRVFRQAIGLRPSEYRRQFSADRK